MSCLALAVAGCQGGGSNPPPVSTGVAPPPSVTTSGLVTPAGGSVTTTLGTQTVVVTAPAGALSGSGTLSVTMYANTAAPKALQSTGRKVQTIGAGAVLVTEFTVALSGATLLKPLQASLTTGPAASGSIFRIAGFGSSFDDVDTVTFAGGKATTDQNIAYSRMSLAVNPAGTYYAFYVEPAAQATAAATPVITVTGTPSNPVGMFGTAQFSAAEAQPNGFPYLDPAFSFTLDNATLGKVTTAGAFTAGPIDGTGNITATDTTAGRGNPSGKGAVTVSSQRPGNVGDVFTFTGSLTSTIQLVNRNQTQPQVDTASIALTSTVTAAGTVATPLPAVTTVAHSVETDTYPLLTIKTGTDNTFAYATGTAAGLPATIVPGTVAVISSVATDSNGVLYATQYDPSGVSGNGILDVLPEKAGAFGPNNAVLQYDETDQAKFTRSRAVAASGSYVETGKDALGDTQTITVNADNSATYDARQYSGLRFTMAAPSGSPPRIILRVFNSAGTQIAAFNIASWIPATVTQPSSETDVTTLAQTYPASCNVPTKYGTSGNQIVQTITRVDAALGNLETLTTTTYMAPRVGPVCIQLADSVQTFYDYTGQNGFSLLVSGGTVPLQLTSLAETLTLQSATVEGGTATLSSSRGTSSLSSGGAATVAFARARFEHAVREKTNWMRTQTFNPNFLSQGVKQL